MTVRVVTDSSAVMPRAWADELGVRILPLQLAWDDGEVAEGDLPYSELSRRLERGGPAPKTSAPSPGAYQELFAELLRDNDALLVVAPPTELSTTFASATLAAREVDAGRIRVVDPRTAAAGQGLVALEAARMAATGARLEAVADRAMSVASRVQIWATLSQLDFLRRSGRVPAIAAIGAGALRLQPIVRYAGGAPALAGMTRSAERATERVFAAWKRAPRHGLLHLLAFHSGRGDEAAELCRRVTGYIPDANAAAVEIAAAMGPHTGPGLLGLAWLWDS